MSELSENTMHPEAMANAVLTAGLKPGAPAMSGDQIHMVMLAACNVAMVVLPEITPESKRALQRIYSGARQIGMMRDQGNLFDQEESSGDATEDLTAPDPLDVLPL